MEGDLQQILLEQLRDIHSPEPIGWWPPAIGWWILLFLLLCALVAVGIILYLKYRRDAYRRQAIASAQSLYRQYQKDKDSAGYLGDMNELLRRVIQQITTDESFAENSGKRWISMLDSHGAQPLSRSAATALSEQIYQPAPTIDAPRLHQELTDWIQTHERVGNV